MNVLCFVIDRLHAGFLGAYGNTWVRTPAMDRFAAEAFVFDHAVIDSPRLDLLYRSYWQGLHALYSRRHPPQHPSLGAILRGAGVQTTLLTDDPAVGQHPLAEDFDNLATIDPPWQSQPAAEIDETHIARCFVEAIEQLESAEGPSLMWAHFAALGTTWDAPIELRAAYCEEGDPPPYGLTDPPRARLIEGFDPDEVLGIVQAYAAQVSALDACFDAFLGFLDASDLAAETAVLLTSARGFPLGEHRRIGPCDEALYGELVHVPLMLRLPDRTGQAARSQALVEPADLWVTLFDLLGIENRPESPTGASLLPLVREEKESLRDRLCLIGPSGDTAIRTPGWYLRTNHEAELFAKPDDRWEANNVASRCQEICESLCEAIPEFDQAIQHGRAADLEPLPAALVEGR